MNSAYKTFELIECSNIKSLDIDIYKYQHQRTGAEHYHIKSKNNENVFLVGLRTVPMDSKGVAHILEHTILCGSNKYPVRDPFFMMTRRSLNTFMNAFTSSDWTAYPFASKNKKDFNNLLDVYLDAVFFSRLDKLDFLQEGHRIEFSEEGNIQSPLTYKGVVYNEMKGAMSSSSSQLYDSIYRNLFSKESTYHYNSGGDPEHIVDLSYDELFSFYKKYYHPSNAFFMTYGDIPAHEHQEYFETNVLHKFMECSTKLEINNSLRVNFPQEVTCFYPIDKQQQTNSSYHTLTWALGDNIDLKHSLKMQLLACVLLDNSSSPLMYALEKTALGEAPVQISGLDDSNRELVFICGIEGAEPETASEFLSLVMNVLDDITKNGIELSKLEAVLHQFEIGQREIAGHGYPYGLKLMLSMIPHCVHRGKPILALDIDAVLDELREDIKNPNFIKKLVRENLLENNNRLLLSLNPDIKLRKTKSDQEKNTLLNIFSGMGELQKIELVEMTSRLKSRQEHRDNPDILPRVTISDISPFLDKVEPPLISSSNYSHFQRGTNGLLYKRVIIPLPELTTDEFKNLWLFTQVISELGTSKNNYIEFQELQSRYTGGIGAYLDFYTDKDSGAIKGYFIIYGKSLSRNYNKLSDLIKDLLLYLDLGDQERITEILLQVVSQLEHSIVESGHHYAMLSASASTHPIYAIKHNMNGLLGIKYMKELKSLTKPKSKTGISSFINNISAISEKISYQYPSILTISDEQKVSDYDDFDIKVNYRNSQFILPVIDSQNNHAWIVNSDVNFCAYSFATISILDQDSAILAVAASLLTNGYLHGKVREQGGAYGAGAQYDRTCGVFKIYSYRDPRLGETLCDFDNSINWLKQGNFEQDQVEEAILCQISNIDKPLDPAQEAASEYFRDLYKRPRFLLEEYRNNILKVKKKDIVRMAKLFLVDAGKSRSAVIGKNFSEECENLGFNIDSI